MKYVFDTNAFSLLFRSYYRNRFPSLWKQFDKLVKSGAITSTREVLEEINDSHVQEMIEWASKHKELFPTPTTEEAIFVRTIFQNNHFQQIIETKELLKGGKNADPFIIARAKNLDLTVITMEKERENGAKIPNICRHFNILCESLERFMELEGWEF